MDRLQALDYWAFQLINSFAGKSDQLDFVLATLASDFFIPVGFGLILLHKWFSGVTSVQATGNQKIVVLSLINMTLATALVFILNQWFFRERPFSAHDVNLIFYEPTDSSIPSNFAAVTMGLALPFLKVGLKQTMIVIVMVLIGSVSRICVGIHYPFDVLSGFIVAILAIPITLTIGKYTGSVQHHTLRIARRLIPT